MKKMVWSILTSALIATPVFADIEKYQLDPNHTYVMWHAGHFGYSTQTGKMRASGTLEYDEKNPKNSKVEVTIRAADLATGVPEFDKHLSGKLFFNSDKFPVITFKSTAVHPTGPKNAEIIGNLTLLGVTQPVTIKMVMNKSDVSPLTDKYTLGFSGETEIKRADFGMTTLIPNIDGDIKVNIESEAIKVDDKNANKK